MLKAHFDILAPIYNIIIKQRYPKEIMINCKLKKNGSLLEVGGGTGRFAAYFIDKVKQVWLIDPSKQMLYQAHKSYGNKIKYKLGIAESLPFEDNYFDHVVVSDSLHHWQKQEEGLTEIFRVMKPGGCLAIEEFHPKTKYGYMIKSMERVTMMGSTFHTPRKLALMIKNVGFKITASDWVRNPTYYIIAEK